MFGSKKPARRSEDRVQDFATLIGKESIFEGMLRGSDHYSVAGKVIGDCDLNSTVRVEPGGLWIGNITADVVVIAGSVEGNVSARTKIELAASGRVAGNLAAPAMAIAEGAAFDGQVSMVRSENITRFRERRGIDQEE